MTALYIVFGVVTVGCLAYLVTALLKPEIFP